MKKGLLSILAGALVLVGCQNYDDQFDNLESQISALASTVAGLSQVQSDLSALAGTVSSLASTVNGLGDAIDTAVADGLSDIQSDIDAIEAAVADVASSEEVAALQTAVDASQEDLTDLLAASSVFTGDVVVNSTQTLDAFLAMGAGLNIVNGNVNITVSTQMDQTKVQELVDNILTTVKDFTYTSAASSIAETTFENLTGTRSLTITQGGGMRFPNLVSATNIYLKDDFESTVSVIHFGSLTSVSGIDTDAEENTIRFTKATELHLTSLEYYPPASLTIETDEGAAMPFILDDLDADGDELEDGLTLSIKGPASVAITKIADGSITLEDVASATLTDFKGSVTLTGDVTTFTSNSLVSLTVTAGAGVETLDVTGVADPDATTAAPSYGPTVDLDTLGDLETVTVAGIASSINLGSNNNLTDVTISADVAGSITIDNNSDLSTVTLTGAKATALDVDTNADLASLTVDLTWRKGTATAAKLDGDLDVTDNASLESLTVSSDNLENLEVTGNDELTSLDFTGVTKIGATGTAVVNIYDNDLTATKITNSDDGTTDVADGKTGDKGSVTSTSGMKTLSTYLTAVAADADSAAAVYFDTVESYVDEDDSETTDVVYSSNTAENAGTVLLKIASVVTTPAVTSAKAKFSFMLPVVTSARTMEIWANGSQVLAETTLSNNPAVSASLIASVASIAAADTAGVTLSATSAASPSVSIKFVAEGATTSEYSSTGPVTPAAGVMTASQTFTVSLDGLSIAHSTVTANVLDQVEAFSSAWATKYGSSAATTRWRMVTNATTLKFIAKDVGTRSIGKVLTATIAGHSRTTTNLGYIISNGNGATANIAASDNAAAGTAIVVTLEAQTGGTLSEIGTSSIVSGGTGVNAFKVSTTTPNVVTLTSSYNPLVTNSNANTATDLHVTENRMDVTNPHIGATGASTTATDFSRVAWL